MNVQIVVEYLFFVLYFIHLLNFFVFFLLTLPVCWSLFEFWAHGWVTVSASLPCGRFCPYLGWGVTSRHLFGPIAPMFNNNYCNVVIER